MKVDDSVNSDNEGMRYWREFRKSNGGVRVRIRSREGLLGAKEVEVIGLGECSGIYCRSFERVALDEEVWWLGTFQGSHVDGQGHGSKHEARFYRNQLGERKRPWRFENPRLHARMDESGVGSRWCELGGPCATNKTAKTSELNKKMLKVETFRSRTSDIQTLFPSP